MQQFSFDVAGRWAVEVFVMVILQGFCGVHDISSRFPSAFIRGVTSSIDKVLKSLAADSEVKDSFNLIFLCAVDNYE